MVYYAAALKHISLTERFGAYKTAYATTKNGCKRFILISMHKAENPTDIMVLPNGCAK